MKIIGDKNNGIEDNTSPDLSRKIAKFLNSRLTRAWAPEERITFLSRVLKAENFADLAQSDQEMMEQEEPAHEEKGNPNHDELGKFAPSESSGHGVTHAKALSFDEMLAHPVIDKLLSGEMSLANTKKRSAEVLGALYHSQGYDGKPQVVSETELQSHVEAGHPDIYRALSGDDAETHAEAYRSGEYYAGKGIYGNGTYTAYGKKAKESVMGEEGYGDTIMHLSLHPEAKVMNYDDVLDKSNDLSDEIATKMENAPPDTAERLDMLQRVISNPGYYAVLQGIDAIDVKSMHYMVILNRTTTLVAQKEG